MAQPPSPYWNYGELGPRFGLSELPPCTPVELARREADRRAFRASPRGRFLAALDRLAALPCASPRPAAAAAARSAYSRGFSASSPVDPAELARARLALQSLADYPEAADALAALDEIAAERLPSPADAA